MASGAIKKAQAAHKRERKELAKQKKQAKDEKRAREYEERKRLGVEKFGSVDKWMSDTGPGGGNYMVSRYSFAYQFPGATLSKNGGWYDPLQWEG